MTPPHPRRSPFPNWSLPAALLRVSVTLGVLTVLGALFVASLQRRDLGKLNTPVSHVQQPTAGARRLSLTLSPQLSHTLRLAAAAPGEPALSAQLSPSRQGELQLGPTPLSTGSGRADSSLALTLSRTLRAWPLMVQFASQRGPPGTLTLILPQRLLLNLSLQRPADENHLDLRTLNVEHLTFVSGSGALEATLPAHGTPQLNIRSEDGEISLTVPPGDARTSLEVRKESGDLVLNVPASAEVTLSLRLGESRPTFSDLPKTFRLLNAGADRSVRRFVQRGTPGGPQLTADLTLNGGSLVVSSPVGNGGPP